MKISRGPEKDDKENGGALRGLYTLASMGIQMVASTFIGLLIGYYLDKFFGTRPWLTLLFLLFGIAAGFRNIYETVKKYGG